MKNIRKISWVTSRNNIKRWFSIVFLVLTFTGCYEQTLTVPNPVMEPTIPLGSEIIVDYKAYKSASPERYDIVAYQPPAPKNTIFVFRIIGLPGEKVQITAEGILINGKKITLPEGLKYDPAPTGINKVSLDATNFFLLGDNSAKANDCRYHGPIDRSNILGKVVSIKKPHEWNIQMQIYEKATKKLQINPQDAEAYFERGKAFHMMKQYEKAISDFDKAIELNSKYARAYEGRADVYFGLAIHDPYNVDKTKIDKANADLKKAEELDPTIFDDDKNRGFGYISKKTNEFIFPAVDSTKRHREGNLILGSTTMEKAVKMLPQWPGHGPRLISQDKIPDEKSKIGKVFHNIKYSYNPMVGGDNILLFDKNKILIGIHVYLTNSLYPESKEGKKEQENVKKMLEQFNFKKVSRSDVESTILRDEITPCVTVDIIKPLADDASISTIQYFFTCPIK